MSVISTHTMFRRWLRNQFILEHREKIEELIKASTGRPHIGSAVHEFIEASRVSLQYGRTGWRDIWYVLYCNYLKLKKNKFMTANQIPITEENYLSLRKAYRQAANNKEEEFKWEGHELVTNFAKYVLEYMEMNPIIKPLINEPD